LIVGSASAGGDIKNGVSSRTSKEALDLAGIDFLLPAFFFGEVFFMADADRTGEADAAPRFLGESSSSGAGGNSIMDDLLGEVFLPLAGDFFADLRLAGDLLALAGDLRLAGDFLLAGDFFALAGDFLGLIGAACSSSGAPPRE